MSPASLEDPLDDLVAYESSRYEAIDLDRLCAFSVDLLGQRGLPVTFENVVVTLFRLFPSKFSLMGFPTYPDAARANRAILHCFPKYKNYLTGKARTGYRLTHEGQNAADEAKRRLDGAKPAKATTRKVPRGVADQFMREVTDSAAFKSFKEGLKVDIRLYDVTRLLHATPDSPSGVLGDNMARLIQYSEQTGQQDVHEFLQWAKEEFNLG